MEILQILNKAHEDSLSKCLCGDETTYMDTDCKLHRLTGPAYINTSGRKEWHYHGDRMKIEDPEMEKNLQVILESVYRSSL